MIIYNIEHRFYFNFFKKLLEPFITSGKCQLDKISDIFIQSKAISIILLALPLIDPSFNGANVDAQSLFTALQAVKIISPEEVAANPNVEVHLPLIYERLTKKYYAKSVNFLERPDLFLLCRSDEMASDFLELSLQEIMLRWVNYIMFVQRRPSIVDFEKSFDSSLFIETVIGLWRENFGESKTVNFFEFCEQADLTEFIMADCVEPFRNGHVSLLFSIASFAVLDARRLSTELYRFRLNSSRDEESIETDQDGELQELKRAFEKKVLMYKEDLQQQYFDSMNAFIDSEKNVYVQELSSYKSKYESNKRVCLHIIAILREMAKGLSKSSQEKHRKQLESLSIDSELEHILFWIQDTLASIVDTNKMNKQFAN